MHSDSSLIQMLWESIDVRMTEFSAGSGFGEHSRQQELLLATKRLFHWKETDTPHVLLLAAMFLFGVVACILYFHVAISRAGREGRCRIRLPDVSAHRERCRFGTDSSANMNKLL